MSRFLAAALLLLTCSISIKAQNAPVLLLGAKTRFTPAMIRTTKAEFGKILSPLLRDNMLIVYVEDDLTLRDFDCVDPETGANCFRYLKQATPRTYYAQVEDPLAAFAAVEWREFDEAGNAMPPKVCQAGTVHGYNFSKNYELARNKMLAAHDTAVAKLHRIMPRNCPIVEVYTARVHRLMEMRLRYAFLGRRRLRQKSRRNNTIEHNANDTLSDKYFTFHCQSITFIRPNNKKEPNDEDQIQLYNLKSVQDEPDTCNFNIVLNAADNTTMNMTIKTSNGYYTVSKIVYETDEFVVKDVSAPFNFSYCCAKVEAIGKDQDYIKFEWLQLELHCNPKYPPGANYTDDAAGNNQTTAKATTKSARILPQEAEEMSTPRIFMTQELISDSTTDLPLNEFNYRIKRHKPRKKRKRRKKKMYEMYNARLVERQPASDDTSVFNEPWNCDSALSATALQALFVMSILLCGLIAAVIWIWDIGTNSHLGGPMLEMDVKHQG